VREVLVTDDASAGDENTSPCIHTTLNTRRERTSQRHRHNLAGPQPPLCGDTISAPRTRNTPRYAAGKVRSKPIPWKQAPIRATAGKSWRRNENLIAATDRATHLPVPRHPMLPPPPYASLDVMSTTSTPPGSERAVFADADPQRPWEWDAWVFTAVNTNSANPTCAPSHRHPHREGSHTHGC
jgi:hypothetical protein